MPPFDYNCYDADDDEDTPPERFAVLTLASVMALMTLLVFHSAQ
jgi:hypothetical protein